MSESQVRCVGCGALLSHENAICAHCETNLIPSPAKEVAHLSIRDMIWRVIVTFFGCLTYLLIPSWLYSEYLLKSGLEAALYIGATSASCVFILLFWILFFGEAVAVSVVAMGLWGFVYGVGKLTWLSFSGLVLLITGYSGLLYLDKRFPKLFPENTSENSFIINIGLSLGIGVFLASEAIGAIIGGGFILYLTLGSLLAARYPEWVRRIGIKTPPTSENPRPSD